MTVLEKLGFLMFLSGMLVAVILTIQHPAGGLTEREAYPGLVLSVMGGLLFIFGGDK